MNKHVLLCTTRNGSSLIKYEVTIYIYIYIYIYIPYMQHFLYIILYWKTFFLLRHVSVQSNHHHAIYIGFYENYYAYNGSVVFWFNYVL
jgi:hypothetical protein